MSSERRGGLRSDRKGPRERTRDQLCEEAKRKDVEGRSKMTKAPLIAEAARASLPRRLHRRRLLGTVGGGFLTVCDLSPEAVGEQYRPLRVALAGVEQRVQGSPAPSCSLALIP